MKMKKLLTQCSILSMLAFCAAPPVMAMVDQEDDQRHVGTSIPAPQPQQSAPQPQQQEKEITVKIASLQEFEQAREKYTTSTDPFFPSHVKIELDFFKATSPHTDLLDYALQHGVRNLRLSGQHLDTSYLRKIFSASHIEKLDLGIKLVLTEEDAQAMGNLLASNRSLKTLCVPSLYAGPIEQGVRFRAEFDKSMASAFRVNTTLEEFDMGSSPQAARFQDGFPIAIIDAITDSPNTALRRLDIITPLDVNGRCAVGAMLAANKSVTYLRLCFKDDEEFEALVEGLKKNRTLQHLKLCPSGSNGTVAIMNVLADNPQIPIHTLELTPKGNTNGLRAVGAMLAVNRSVTHLHLFCGWVNKGFEALAEGLRYNRTLQHLGLFSDSNGTTAIMKALADNPQIPIHTLDISNSEFDEEGVSDIRRFLKNTTTLKNLHLYLVLTRPPKIMAQVIADGIRLNTSLEMVDLRRTEVNQEGVRALLAALEGNASVKEIKLWGNDLTAEQFATDPNSSRLSF